MNDMKEKPYVILYLVVAGFLLLQILIYHWLTVRFS